MPSPGGIATSDHEGAKRAAPPREQYLEAGALGETVQMPDVREQ